MDLFLCFTDREGAPSPHMRWRIASIGIVTFVVLLRLIYLGQAQLIPDEAYYWKYAQHMDWSFLITRQWLHG